MRLLTNFADENRSMMFPRMLDYLNPIFDAGDRGIGDKRWPGGLVTKIPYFRGGGSGGNVGGNDGSRIFK